MLGQRRAACVAAVTWGALLALWLARGFFLHPTDAFFANHEFDTYAGRLVEFRDLLGAGYWSPQWCSDFRGGLGAPYFSYYQPGVFYLASLVPWCVPVVRSLGIVVWAVSLLGYVCLFALVTRRFGMLSGWLAGSALLLSSYVGTEIYRRGDLSELAAMMMLPAALWTLWDWLEQGGRTRAALLALTGGALVVLHPAVALIGYGILTLGILVFWVDTRDLRRAGLALLALGAGVGLAAFYWFPVFLEWRLVNPEQAFAGFYSFTEHFVHPLALVGLRAESTVIPPSLGPVLPLLVLVNLVVLLCRWSETTAAQRRMAGFCLAAILLGVFLMWSASAPVWSHAPLLYRLQFPWRILTVVTVVVAALGGAMLPWKNEELRTILVGTLVLTLCGCAWHYTRYSLDDSLHPVQTVAQLRQRSFAPDLRDEWLPRGATTKIPLADAARPVAGPGCRVEDFARRQGRLACHVRTQRESFVVLPHYYFPVGFRATLSGRPIAFDRDARGLMRVNLPAGTAGPLEIVFTQTPMRLWGLLVSGVSLLGLGLCWLLAPLAARRQPGPQASVDPLTPATRHTWDHLAPCPPAA